MKKFLLAVFGLMLSAPLYSQVAAVNGYCSLGGTQSLTSSLKSTNYLNGVVIGCQITPVLTGTTTPAQYSLNASGIPVQTGPFTANTYGSLNPGAFLFFAPVGNGLDVVASGGIPPNSYPQPITILTDIIPGGGGGGGIGYPPAGIPHSSGSSWLASFGIQGSDINVMTSGAISETGAALCTDANGGATTSGCLSGTLGGSVSPFFTPYSNANNQLVNSPDFWDSTGALIHTFVSTTKEVHQTSEADFIGALGVGGSIAFKQGTAPTVLTSNVRIAAPASVTGYNFLLPGTQGTGCLADDGSGNGSWAQCGGNIQPQIIPPTTGNFVILYPSTAVSSSTAGCTSATAAADGTAASGSVTANSCPTGFRSSIATFTGFTLPSYVSAVTQVYAFSVSKFFQTGAIMSVSMGCNTSAPYYTGGFGIVGNPSGGPGGSASLGPYLNQQITTLTTFGGADIPNIGCALFENGSSIGTGELATASASAVGLIVYGTITPPTPTNSVLTVSPLTASLDSSGNTLLSIDTTWPFPGLYLNATPTGSLPNANGLTNGGVYFTPNGSTSTDCTTGGGTNPVWCVSNGSTYTGYSLGGSDGGITQLTGDIAAGPGSGSQAATLATVNSGPGACGDATHVCAVTTNNKGLVTAQTSTAITIPVSSVSNIDGTLTISPTTGSVVASLAIGHANTWTGVQTLTAPIINTDPGHATQDSIYFAGSSNPAIWYAPASSQMAFATPSTGTGGFQFFIGNQNNRAYMFSPSSIILAEDNGATSRFIDFAVTHLGAASPLPSGLTWHLGASNALSGSLFQDTSTQAWHWNAGSIASPSGTDLMTLFQNGTLALPALGSSANPLCTTTGGVIINSGCTGGGSGDTITSPGATITVGGTSIATTLDVALGHPNTWTGTQTIPLGTASSAVTQTVGDNTTKVATDAFVLANAGSISAVSIGSATLGVDSGTVNAYVVATTPTFGSLVAGTTVRFLALHANTNNDPTVDVNGIGTVQIVNPNGVNNLNPGDINTTNYSSITYNGTFWVLNNPQATQVVQQPTSDQTITSGANNLVPLIVRGGSNSSDAFQVFSNSIKTLWVDNSSQAHFAGNTFFQGGSLQINSGGLGCCELAGAGLSISGGGSNLDLLAGSGNLIRTNQAMSIGAPQTTVSCSTSGSAIFSQPDQGASDKKVLIHMSACLGTASYTFPTAFTNTPSIYASNNVAASIATSISTTAVTVTGATTTGSLLLEDF